MLFATVLLMMLMMSPTQQQNDSDFSLDDMRQGLALSDFVMDERESSDFLGAEISEDDFAEVRRQFIEMIRERNPDPESFFENFALFQNTGGVFGDPHFVLPLTKEVNLCFNWMENSKEFDNLIATEHHYVNARMLPRDTRFHVTGSEKPRVFVGALAFVVPRHRMSIMMHPSKVEIKFHGKTRGGSDIIEFPTSKGEVYAMGEVRLSVDDVRGKNYYLSLKLSDTTYRIILRAGAERPHVNFYFRNLTLSTGGGFIDGIAGQFYSKPIRLTPTDEDGRKAIIQIGDDLEVRAQRHHLNGQDPFTGLVRQCWLVTQDSQKFFMDHRQRYQIDSLLAKPAFLKNGSQ